MDRLLNRGKYAIEPEALGEQIGGAAKPIRKRWNLYKLIGIDEHFSRTDRWITIGIFIWSMTSFLVFVFGSIWYLIRPWSDKAWTNYWFVTAVYLPLLIGIVTTVWFVFGCTHDMRVFFRRLREERANPLDDGTVYHEAGEEPATRKGV
jgi:SSS family solute:Na+ symporter